MANAERQPGYYWVRKAQHVREWQIARWDFGSGIKKWLMFGCDAELHDADFAEIDERRLERG